MAVLVFKDDDEGFKQWLRENPAGYVVHTRTVKLHRNDCDHIYPPGYDKGESLTRVPKAVGTDRAELEMWSLGEGKGLLKPCEGCGT